MFNELRHLKQFNWKQGSFAIAAYTRVKADFDRHLAAVADAWIKALDPRYEYWQFLGVLNNGVLGEPLVRVQGIHTEAMAFSMVESLREYVLPLSAFISADRFEKALDVERSHPYRAQPDAAVVAATSDGLRVP